MRILLAAMGRPTIANALVWSLSLHLSAAAVTGLSWLQPVEQVSLAGMRNVVQMEAAFAADKVPPRCELALPIERQRPTRQRPLETHQFVQAARLPLAPVGVVAPVASDDRPTSEFETTDYLPAVDNTAVPRRREDQRPERGVAPAPARPPRRETEIRMPETSVAAVQVAGVDDASPPDFLDNPPPPYPAAAIARRMEGTVLLRLHIAATGQVTNVEIVTSSGHGMLDQAAQDAVMRWQGIPAYRAGVAVPTVEVLPVRFRL